MYIHIWRMVVHPPETLSFGDYDWYYTLAKPQDDVRTSSFGLYQCCKQLQRGIPLTIEIKYQYVNNGIEWNRCEKNQVERSTVRSTWPNLDIQSNSNQ